ncbi:MAG: hypothetical protein AAB589_01030 [Patescibacteria group bacterium]
MDLVLSLAEIAEHFRQYFWISNWAFLRNIQVVEGRLVQAMKDLSEWPRKGRGDRDLLEKQLAACFRWLMAVVNFGCGGQIYGAAMAFAYGQGHCLHCGKALCVCPRDGRPERQEKFRAEDWLGHPHVNLGLRDWQRIIGETFALANSELSDNDFFTRCFQELAELTSVHPEYHKYRGRDATTLISEQALESCDLTAWLIGIANRESVRVDLEKLVMRGYEERCHFCPRVCVCGQFALGRGRIRKGFPATV